MQWPKGSGIPDLMSFFIKGLGQIYKGLVLNGFAWLVFVVIGYFPFIIPGVILHFLCILGAKMGNPKK